MKMKLENAFYVEPECIAGGLALCGEPEWFGTFIYAPSYEDEKQCFWEKLGALRNDVNAKWCIMGDTNTVASPTGKYGGAPFDHNNAKWYHEFLERTFLIEIQSKGGAYTWSNQRSEEEEICEKLDRVLTSLEWGFLFPKTIVFIDAAIASDHAPVVTLLNGLQKKFKKNFKFESSWLIEEECSQIVKEEWVSTGGRHQRGTFRVNLRRTKVKLGKWSREKFGKNRLTANNIIKEIKELQEGPLNKEDALKLKDLKT
ncbi:hypothetical protein V6N11_011289 [Hibiscus sabdariffa]|uniref:Endonuclease/exonuclease/phosphatase domain-containing protein n=1 Tax=Hibiscus sabdariffa TaxID=183260 RepID=A0ABR2S8H3_9ROSI